MHQVNENMRCLYIVMTQLVRGKRSNIKNGLVKYHFARNFKTHTQNEAIYNERKDLFKPNE